MAPKYPIQQNIADGIEVDVPTGGDGIPAGTIALWSPLNGAVPAGWAECDGVANAPGPDLRDRFVIGRGPSHSVDASGGSATHTHPGHTAHVMTQPAAHVVTQPSGHSAHVVSQPTTHVFTQPDAHASLTHDAHTQGRKGGTTNPQDIFNAPVTHAAHAGQSHAGGAVSVHSGTAVDAHSAHSGGTVDAHSDTAVDAHSAHDTPNSEPTWYALIYVQKT